MKHVCFDWLPNRPRTSTRMHPQRLQYFLCRLHFGEDRVGYPHRAVKNLFDEPVYHGKAGNGHLCAIRDRIAIPRYMGLERPKNGSLFKSRRLLCMPRFVIRTLVC